MSGDPVNEVRVGWRALFRRIDGFYANRENHLVIDREIVPVVFVPGFMGSRLRLANGDKVWDPDDGYFMARSYSVAARPRDFRTKLAERKELLLGGPEYDGGRLVIYDDDDDHNRDNFGRHPGAAERGWGGVAWTFYGPILDALQTLAEPVAEPVRHCFEFPVHAFGYDWTRPTEDVAVDLAAYVRQTIESYRRHPGGCDHVVLVTHSRGGLVAREALRTLGDSAVLGAIHCGQPVHGAASAYWRMKAGAERPPGVPPGFFNWIRHPFQAVDDKFAISGRLAAWVLGPYGEATTSLLGNMPGALSLLPSDSYRDARGRRAWLRYPAADGTEVALPTGSVYDDVYLEERKFYKLIEKAWLVLADPAADLDDEAREFLEEDMADAWGQYVDHLNVARKHHESLGAETHHPLTVQIAAWGLRTVDHVGYTRSLDGTYWQLVRRLVGAGRTTTSEEATAVGKAVGKEEAKEAPRDLLPQVWDALPNLDLTDLGDLVTDAWDPSFTTAIVKRLRRFGTKVVSEALMENADWARLGGYRARVDRADLPVDHDRSFRTVETDGTPEPVYLLTLEAPADTDTFGDGTVALSSASALTPWHDVPVSPADEALRDSSHSELYQARTVQRATARAIQNLCFRRIAAVERQLRAPGAPPQPPAPPRPPDPPASRQRPDGTWTPGDHPRRRRIALPPPDPVEGLPGPDVESLSLTLRPRAPADSSGLRPFEGYGDAFGDEE